MSLFADYTEDDCLCPALVVLTDLLSILDDHFVAYTVGNVPAVNTLVQQLSVFYLYIRTTVCPASRVIDQYDPRLLRSLFGQLPEMTRARFLAAVVVAPHMRENERRELLALLSEVGVLVA